MKVERKIEINLANCFECQKSFFSSCRLFFSLALLSLGNSIKLNASDGEARARFSTLEIETREEKHNRNNIATTTSNVKKISSKKVKNKLKIAVYVAKSSSSKLFYYPCDQMTLVSCCKFAYGNLICQSA